MSVITLDGTKRERNDSPVLWIDGVKHKGDASANVAGSEFSLKVFWFGRHYWKVSYAGEMQAIGMMKDGASMEDAKRTAENAMHSLMVQASMVQEG